ncbi:MAG: sporulation protein YunB [Bacillota bacterium]
MRYRRRQRRNPPGSIFSFFVLAALLYLIVHLFFIIERNLRPAVLAIAEIKADGLATDAINIAILENVARGIHYKDLIVIEQDDQGRIVMAQINSMEVNRIMAETTIATREALHDLEDSPFEIPLGEVMDSFLLATYGPKIPVRMSPLGRVNTDLVDSFEDAGINQTRHKIYLRVHTEVQIIIPFIADSVEVITTVPVADAIYMGDVPDTVINLQLPGGSFTYPNS